jgi:hypothetical protein
VEGYFCESRKTWGVFCKTIGPAGFDRAWLVLTRSRPVGSRSDGCGGCGLSGGGGIESGPLDHDPAARDACKRLAAGQ